MCSGPRSERQDTRAERSFSPSGRNQSVVSRQACLVRLDQNTTQGRSTEMQARGTIAVAGATGRVGHHVVDVLEGRGHEVIAISRSSGVDVVTGEGLAEALARGRGRDRRGHRPVARGAGSDRVLHRGRAEPATGRPPGRRAADRRGVDHRDPTDSRRATAQRNRPTSGQRYRARSRRASCAPRSSTSSWRSSSTGADRTG